MRVEHLKPSFKDARGLIIDLIQNCAMEHATLVTSKTGAIRGHHYHKESTQYVVVLSGRMEAYARGEGETKVESVVVEPWDLVVNEALERHALVALEDSIFLVLTHGPRGGDQYESDTFREQV